MSMPRDPKAAVGFVDQYCAYYRELFADVRSFAQFTALHVGLIAELPRKTLPEESVKKSGLSICINDIGREPLREKNLKMRQFSDAVTRGVRRLIQTPPLDYNALMRYRAHLSFCDRTHSGSGSQV